MWHWPWKHRWTLVAAQPQLTWRPGTSQRGWSALIFFCKCGKMREKQVWGQWVMPEAKSVEIQELEKLFKLPVPDRIPGGKL